MKRVLFISGMYPPFTKGGAEVSAHLLARGLMKLGWEVDVLAEGKESTDDVDGIKVFHREIGLTQKPLMEYWHARVMGAKVKRFIQQREPYDIVHAHDFRAVQAISDLGISNAITTVRDYAQICGSPNNLGGDGQNCQGCENIRNAWKNRSVQEAPLVRKPFRWWQYWHNIGFRLESFRQIKNHVYISWAQLEEVKRHQDLNGINASVIYNPIQPEYLEAIRKIGDPYKLLYVGTMESYKGVGILLDAFKLLEGKEKQIRLKLVGAGAQLDKYRNLAKEYGLENFVEFTGRINDSQMLGVYDDAGTIIAPHIWLEPFGRTTVEAMARGKVVIAADHGGPGEVIKKGVTGVLFKKGDAHDLADAINKVINWPNQQREAMGEAAQSWVRANLRLEKIAEQYHERYLKILAK